MLSDYVGFSGLIRCYLVSFAFVCFVSLIALLEFIFLVRFVVSCFELILCVCMMISFGYLVMLGCLWAFGTLVFALFVASLLVCLLSVIWLRFVCYAYV